LESLRETIRQTLEDANFLVLPATNAEPALDPAQSCAGSIGLLITTLHPGGMAGPDLAFRLRIRSPEMSVIKSSANPLALLEIPDPAEVLASMLPRPFSKTTHLSRINTRLGTHT
jgi:DNA-binding response OmpR family regulator